MDEPVVQYFTQEHTLALAAAEVSDYQRRVDALGYAVMLHKDERLIDVRIQSEDEHEGVDTVTAKVERVLATAEEFRAYLATEAGA